MNFAPPSFRFRTLRGRLVAYFCRRSSCSERRLFALVLNANRRNALRQFDTNLETGARIFTTLKNQRIAALTRRGLTLGGEEKKVTILFSDLRDFTPLSERLTPSELLDILNRYFTRMSQIVDAHGGVVDKYIGDALAALFGAPLEQPDQAAHALVRLGGA